MALILEIRDERGVPSWHRLESLPVTLGRGLSNSIILDDPYLDAQHARITLGESGELRLDDLESTNGMSIDGSRTRGSVAIEAGSEVRIGRTVLRFRDIDEAVAPAIAENGERPEQSVVPTVDTMPVPVVTPGIGVKLLDRVLETKSGQLGITAVMLAAFTWSAWSSETDGSEWSTAFGGGFIVAALVMVWAGLWTLGGRSGERRHHLSSHLAVASVALLVLFGWNVVSNWLSFLFPDASVIGVLFVVIFLVVVAGVIAGHLGVSGNASRKARWRVGGVVAGTMIVLFGFVALVSNDEDLTGNPKVASVVRPFPVAWLPARTVAEFGEDMRELKGDVDEAHEKRAAKESAEK